MEPEVTEYTQEEGELFGEGEEKQQNPFEEAMERIKAGQRLRRGGVAKEKDVRKVAEKLVRQMRIIHQRDIEAISLGNPAIHRAKNIDAVCRLIQANKVGLNFVLRGGCLLLAEWLQPFDDPDIPEDCREPPVAVVQGVLKILKTLGRNITREDLLKSRIGIEVRRVMENPELPQDLRVAAQELVTDWVGDVTGVNKRAPKEEELEEALEVDERGRLVRDSDGGMGFPGQSSSSSGGFQQKRTEQELQKIWAPTELQQEEFQKRMYTRHAVMPNEKPVFDPEAAPVCQAPSKKRFKEDPTTGAGRIASQLQKISNPNKKAWKSAVEGVSISGRTITQRW